MLLCVPAIAKTQSNNPDDGKLFSRYDFLHVKTDSFPAGFSQSSKLHILDKGSLPSLKTVFSPKQLFGQLNLPVNTKSPIIRINKTGLSNEVGNTSASADNQDATTLNTTTLTSGVS